MKFKNSKFIHYFIGKKFVIVLVLIMVAISCIFNSVVSMSVSRLNGITIVLDAGHGGRDGGSIGVNGTIEKEINLEYVLSLKRKLICAGYKVILTRETDEGLYSPFAKNKKVSDMEKRQEIIKQANPNLVVSIHMNSFVNESAYGATTYYRIDDEASKQVGDLVQGCLKTYCDARLTESKVGDYFMVNCSYYTSILVECGFISNREEEKNLNTEEYKDKITSAIAKGIGLYFGFISNI